MTRILTLVCLLAVACAPSSPPPADLGRWEAHASRVTITRDDWGIAHVKGQSDADAVFGLMYAQAEDDFNRIEVNLLNAMGRLAEAEGESALWRDLRMQLFVQPDTMKALYATSTPDLQSLMTAWADGLNYFLHTHPEVTPRVLTSFEPWMALTFSEGSIGGDIESVSLRQLEAFYGSTPAPAPTVAEVQTPREPTGSNGFAVAPSRTANGHALLLINPHTSFFFRSEVQVTSDEGLNAYGAVTWGQFFIYQGFNATAGWMHTSSGADVIDEYAEEVIEQNGARFYRYDGALRPLRERTVTLRYRSGDTLAVRMMPVYATHHGPVVRSADGRWITVRLMQEPVKALTQSYRRTKARNLAEFRTTMELHTNSSNNTVFADADGNIAYFHANHVPRRSTRFNWRQPVDGTDPATEWGPLHGIDDSPLAVNPASGWIQNTNNWPYSVAGPTASPKPEEFPAYMDAVGENPRGIHAMAVLAADSAFTLESLRAAAYDSHMPPFDQLIPTLVAAFDALPAADTLRSRLAEPVDALRNWDRRWSAASVPTTLAIVWAETLATRVRAAADSAKVSTEEYVARRASALDRVHALAAAVNQLTADFGRWQTPWGEINRFQRLTGDIEQPFSDAGASIAVPFTSARWGSLASFGARTYPGTKKRYGTSGNSFVAVVEFGDSVRAIAVTAGGESGNPASKHFNDQAARYAEGKLRPVYFYPNQLEGHVERQYRPGERSAN